MAFKTSVTGLIDDAKESFVEKTGILAMYGSSNNTDGLSLVRTIFVGNNDTIVTADISYGRIIVGAQNNEVAYIYDLHGNVISTLSGNKPGVNGFGTSVSAGTHSFVVGEWTVIDDGFMTPGVAYIYDFNGNSITEVEASDGNIFDEYATSVAAGNGVIVVGSPKNDGVGSAYMYKSDGTFIKKIVSPDPKSNGAFGNSVAINNHRIVITDIAAAIGKPGPATSFVYDISGNLINKINTINGDDDENFGVSCAIGSGRIVILGARAGENTGSLGGDTAYVCDLNGNLIKRITSPDNNGFSRDLEVESGRIFIGSSPSDSDDIVYIYDLDGNLIETVDDLLGSNVTAIKSDLGKVVVTTSNGVIHLYDTPYVITPYDVRDWERS